MKIYRRLRTWMLILLLIALTSTLLIIIHNETPALKDGNWKAEVQEQIADGKSALQSDKNLPEDIKADITDDIKENEYRLSNNLPPSDRSVWGGVLNAANLIIIVTIFTVVIAADSVAGEFGGGTIKLLLIRPASRSKILLSKYISILIFSVLLLGVLFGSSFLLSGFMEGFKDIGVSHIYTDNEHVIHQVSIIGHVIQTYGYNCVDLIMIVTMAFMLSTVFRSSSLAIGISLGLLFVGSGIDELISRYSWSKYYLFTNTDLSQYLNDSPRVEGMTLQFSIAVLVVYFLVFNLLSWSLFKKRDVAA
ncbi:ABC transporter permease [Paenibacillus psychroresistens]|nr:ABC transporter permease [Paenibacillus psychroresistens]